MAHIEEYGLIGDTRSVGLVSTAGSLDWLCLPRFDSGSCFAHILDPEKGGRWKIAPKGEISRTRRRYRDRTMILETTFETQSGEVRLVDCLPIEEGYSPKDPREIHPSEVVIRLVQGISGKVEMEMEYAPRFDYGYVVPWFRELDDGSVECVGGPDALDLRSDVNLTIEGLHVVADFEISERESVAFLASHRQSHEPPDELGPADCAPLIERTQGFWRDWLGHCTYDGRWRDIVERSLLVLKALTYSPTGGIVAAATTSLPEDVGGVRNWDYRYCWLRDATMMLDVLLDHGFTAEAVAWRDWLLRAVGGAPEEMQIMYGVRGERRLPELELEWLSGYAGSRPVRIGNAAVQQFQLDVFGELMDTLHAARRARLEVMSEAWELQRQVAHVVCERWREPDSGIWEVRSAPKHFTHSKVMAWVALDRAIAAVEKFGLDGDAERWEKERDEIRAEVFERGYDDDTGRFKRAYDDPSLDASLLMLPLVGFLDATDHRMRATIEAIEADLTADGFVLRYRHEETDDGLPGEEGTFVICTCWLADCFVLLGRHDDSERLFERVVSVSNDLGLLSEQYSAEQGRFLGNFPQAFSHIAVLATAIALETAGDTAVVNRQRR